MLFAPAQHTARSEFATVAVIGVDVCDSAGPVALNTVSTGADVDAPTISNAETTMFCEASVHVIEIGSDAPAIL